MSNVGIYFQIQVIHWKIVIGKYWVSIHTLRPSSPQVLGLPADWSLQPAPTYWTVHPVIKEVRNMAYIKEVQRPFLNILLIAYLQSDSRRYQGIGSVFD